MKNKILFSRFVLIVFILFVCGLNCTKSVKDDSIASADEAGSVGYWLDPETSTVHKMINVDEKKKVVSIIRYDDGIKTEVMDIIKSEIVDGKINWAYYVPSTGYTVEMKAVSFKGNKIIVKWKNRNAEGGTDSGDETLIRCAENGKDLQPRNNNTFDDTLNETNSIE